MESFLNFCLSGVRHVQRFYPHAELVSIRAGTRDGQAVRVPQLLKAVTLDLNPDARDSRSEKLLSISSNALGQWGEVEVLGREVVGLAHYYIDDPSRPPMIDLLEAYRLFAAAGYEFYFDHITLEKPVFRDAEEEYYYFTSVSEDLKIGVGARSGRISVYRGEGSGRVSRLGRRRSEADIERSIERSRSRSLERRQSRSNQALVQNINTAVRIVGERYPGARLLTVKALKKELAPALDVVKYHVTFQYNAGHVDIFSSSRWGEWGVPVFTEGRLPHWHNVPFSVDSEDVGDGTEWVVRAKL